jgi:hypothetical protein
LICLALIPIAVLGLVQHHPHGSLHLVLLVVLGQHGLAAAGVSEGGDGSKLAHPRTGAGVQWCHLVGWLIYGHLHWGIFLGQTSFHSKPSCPHGSLANSHLSPRGLPREVLMMVLLLMKVEKTLQLVVCHFKHADDFAEAELH